MGHFERAGWTGRPPGEGVEGEAGLGQLCCGVWLHSKVLIILLAAVPSWPV